MKRTLSIFAFIGLLAGVVTIAPANAGIKPPNRPSSTFKDGPYASTSTDSGTCGPDWAIDLFSRVFVAKLPSNPDGTYTVKETFNKGRFLTTAGQSPGACQPSGPHGANIRESVQGSFGGTFTIIVSNGTFDGNGSCQRDPNDNQCTTAGWVAGFFGPSATYEVPVFNFTYTASSGQGLIYSSWTNADTGNSGDIASS